MTKGNITVLVILAAIFAFAVCALVYPLFDREGMRMGLDLQGGLHIVYQADLSEIDEADRASALEGTKEILTNRINPLGVTEPIIQIQGSDRILVELPGTNISDTEKERLGRVDILAFAEQAADDEEATWENALGRWKPATGEIDGEELALTSRYFKENTYVARDDLGQLLLVFEWDETGAQLSEQVTTRLLNQPLAIFDGDNALLGDDGLPIAPTVNDIITDSGVIEGLSLDEATSLSNQLNYGRLPVSLSILYDQTVSPTLGEDFVDMSLTAGIIGIILVMLFMIIYYRLPGLLASLALVFYGALVMAIFKLIPVTLTLAGIGGFILSIGMAVDANVLIFERMKEEFAMGRTLGAAIDAGFSRAWTAIRDSNITTLIVCAILLWLGGAIVESAPVQGFALTLGIGVLVSMFTAIVVTRTLLHLFVGTPLARRTALFSAHREKK
ncbi:MAG: protein translocase subunit SecD [Dehalococcoidia bacterium]|jgi:preprotein translocase subunit SecD